MKTYLSRILYKGTLAGIKAPRDVETILQEEGFHCIGFHATHRTNWKLTAELLRQMRDALALWRMPKEKPKLLMQFPSFADRRSTSVLQAVKRAGGKVAILVHDIDMLRGRGNLERLRILEQADCLVLHTPAMKAWVEANLHCGRVLLLDVFDYLYPHSIVPVPPTYSPSRKSIAFAGNLPQSLFLEQWYPNSERLKVRLFGTRPSWPLRGMTYVGSFPFETLYQELKSMFGLVWDGTSPDTCAGAKGEYLRYIAPHKLSLYLTAATPVVVWSESAMRPFVESHGCGFAVASLSELEERLQSLGEEEYKAMVLHAAEVGRRLRAGYYLRRVLHAMDEELN